MITCLYNFFIFPLVLIMEFIFSIMYRIFDNVGLAIVSVSIAVNVLSLPLYRRADAIQDEERRMQKLLAEPVKHIKKTFKGDERFMMLQAYYTEQKYSPLYVFRGSLPLLLQIPFFTAAYNYLSNLSLLTDASFWIIKDMGSPDQLLTVFGITINVLPILMTLINFISGMIYTRGFALKDKAQLYILALVFLVFLYDRPAGLVFYWTLNNLFSLIKNIFLKVVPDPGKTLSWLLGEAGLIFAVYFISTGKLCTYKRAAFLIVVFTIFNLPKILRYIGKCRKEKPDGRITGITDKLKSFVFSVIDSGGNTGVMWFASAVCLTVIFGMLIPMSVISASPVEFVTVYNYINPLFYVASTASIAAGYFLLWGGAVIYFFGNKVVKEIQAYIVFILAGASLMNYMLFGRNFGTLSNELEFTEQPSYTSIQMAVNILALAVMLVILTCIYRWKKRLALSLAAIVILSGTVLTVYNTVKVKGELSQIAAVQRGVDYAGITEDNAEKILRLSRNGKNVVVILLDRAISGYVPYMFNERPELEKQFAGFTYYPNTISFGEHTMFGAPAVYGGYDYTPDAINKRSDVTLAEKINESDMVMPLLFSENGYQTTICDPSYAGYKDVSDLSIYDDYPDIKTYNTRQGQYTGLLSKDELAAQHDEIKYRNFFWYSVFKASPLFMQSAVYDSGNYFCTTKTTIGKGFLKNYPVLKSLPILTDISDDTEGSFFMIHNNTTHQPSELQMPDYVPDGNVNNSGLDDPDRFTLNGRTVDAYKEEIPGKYHYHVNMCAFIQLGKWFDYLREEGIYDNTKIILVADHGYFLGQFEDMIVNDELDVEAVNPLLMVKDFNETGFTTDDSFMTNGDVPTLAMEGVIEDPVNPFTGNAINSDDKYSKEMRVTLSHKFDLKDQDQTSATLDTSDAHWYTVKDNIFDKSNWKRESEVGDK